MSDNVLFASVTAARDTATAEEIELATAAVQTADGAMWVVLQNHALTVNQARSLAAALITAASVAAAEMP